MSESVARPRLIMSLLLVFAGVGVILGAVGVYGVIAYAVGERRREIGVRIALGAEPGRVAGAVLAQGVRYAALGVAIGLAGSLAVTRVMRTLVFGVSTTDPADVRRAVGFPGRGGGAGELPPGASGGADRSDGGVARGLAGPASMHGNSEEEKRLGGSMRKQPDTLEDDNTLVAKATHIELSGFERFVPPADDSRSADSRRQSALIARAR